MKSVGVVPNVIAGGLDGEGAAGGGGAARPAGVAVVRVAPGQGESGTAGDGRVGVGTEGGARGVPDQDGIVAGVFCWDFGEGVAAGGGGGDVFPLKPPLI